MIPANDADQEWQNTIGEVFRTWETTAEYMINKRDAGRGMIDAQEAFIARSVEAIGIPIWLYTHRKTHVQAITECQEITALGDTWCNDANRYYSLQPDGQRQQRGIVELLDNMELLRDYDYDAARLAIQQNINRALIVYKTNSTVNMRTVASIRTQDTENLAIFREIYGQHC